MDQILTKIKDVNLSSDSLFDDLRACIQSRQFSIETVLFSLLGESRDDILSRMINHYSICPDLLDDEGNSLVGCSVEMASTIEERGICPEFSASDPTVGTCERSLICVLESGADPNLLVRTDILPIELAVKYQLPGMVAILLTYGASMHLYGDHNATLYNIYSGSPNKGWAASLSDRIEGITKRQ